MSLDFDLVLFVTQYLTYHLSETIVVVWITGFLMGIYTLNSRLKNKISAFSKGEEVYYIELSALYFANISFSAISEKDGLTEFLFDIPAHRVRVRVSGWHPKTNPDRVFFKANECATSRFLCLLSALPEKTLRKHT